MTDTPKNIAAKAIKMANERTETTRQILRRNRLAYLGLHGIVFDQAKSGAEKLRKDRKSFFNELVAKGEEMEAGATKFFKGAKSKAKDKVEDITDDIEDFAEDTRAKVWNLLPGATVNRVEALEAELQAAKQKLKTVTSETIPVKTKRAAKKAATPVKAKAKTAAKTTKKVADKAKAAAKDAAPTKSKTAAPKKATAKKEQPRHIPYFNDVKRYDPLASEDVVRAIVNHCGISLQSRDASYVACSDETERNLVRDSWYKRKLEVKGSDAELDKKVQNVCSIMQRDNLKNRVTFYYLAAKAERKLDVI